MKIQAAVITISDKGAAGTRIDTAGPAICSLLKTQSYEIVETCILPDDITLIKEALLTCCDNKQIPLVITVGGTGFSPRDVTPEATCAVIERNVPGIPELMRAESMKITPNGCLSRAVCGIRGKSLILNLPGSEKAATENLSAVIAPLAHGLKMLLGSGSADCGAKTAIIRALRTAQNNMIDQVRLCTDSIVQLNIIQSTKDQPYNQSDTENADNAFDNIFIEGIARNALTNNTRLRIGTALCAITQLGKVPFANSNIYMKVLKGGIINTGDTVMLL